MMQTQFGEQQNLLTKIMLPQLTQMATNPQGFGAQQLAAIRAQTIGTIGTQLAAQQKAFAQQFSTANMAGLGSGPMAALQANLGATAAGAEASSLQELNIANAQAKIQQQQWGLGALGQATQLLGAAPQSAGLALSASGQSFQQQQQMAQQGGFWSNLLTGVIGGAANVLTGGMSGLITQGVGALGSLFKGQQPLQVAGGGGPAAPSFIGAGAMADPNMANVLAYPTAMPTLAQQQPGQ